MIDEPTPLQLEVLDAYGRARRLFDAIDQDATVLELAREHATAELPALRAQAAAIRWANVHRWPGPDVTIAMHLVGALGRLAGGATLGVQPTPAYLIDGWLHALWFAGILAGANRLAIGPILTAADRMRAAEPWDGVQIAAGLVDLAVITTSAKNPARTADDLNAERMAMFGALGQAVCCATVTLVRTVTGWPQTMTLADWYTVAVETVTGEHAPARPPRRR